eukprot:2265578-Heterocapsa_arctica.AAC.1
MLPRRGGSAPKVAPHHCEVTPQSLHRQSGQEGARTCCSAGRRSRFAARSEAPTAARNARPRSNHLGRRGRAYPGQATLTHEPRWQ